MKTSENSRPGRLAQGRLHGRAERRGEVDIRAGVTDIGDYAFSCCPELTNVVIPGSVTKIGKDALKGCTVFKAANSLPTRCIPPDATCPEFPF